MKTVVVATLIAAISLLGAKNARADIITEDFSFSPVNNLAVGAPQITETSPITQFDPTKGTLTSVSISGQVNVNFVGAGSTSSNQLAVSLEIANLTNNITSTGGSPFCSSNPCSFPLNPTVDPSTFSDFISGVGSAITATMNYTNISSFPNDLTFTDTVSYTFTPGTAAVPEPPIGRGLPVLLIGLLLGAKLLERGKRLPTD
jgi:hypothetical protein